MKVFAILAFVFLFTSSSDSVEYNQESDFPIEYQRNGSIEGIVQLATRSRGIRSGGGLYGRPARNAQQSTSTDSVLVVLTGSSTNERDNSNLVFLNQKDRAFQPKLLPVKMGQTVRILNSDPVYHNVFSLTSPHKFDVGRRPQGDHYDVTFEKAGAVDVFCDIHSNMHAIIYVMPDNALAWVKLASGDSFSFKNIPNGDYQLTFIAMGYSEHEENARVIESGVADLGTVTLNP